MTIAQFLNSPDPADMLVIVLLAGAFAVGYATGAVRRLIGLLAMVFSFLVAGALQAPVGGFLAGYWRTMPVSYSAMVAYLAVFVAGIVLFAFLIHDAYNRVELMARHPWVDEFVGGIVGVIEAIVFLAFVLIALDRGFQLAPSTTRDLPEIRNVWSALTLSVTGSVLHSTLIPAFVNVTWILLPEVVRGLYKA